MAPRWGSSPVVVHAALHGGGASAARAYRGPDQDSGTDVSRRGFVVEIAGQYLKAGCQAARSYRPEPMTRTDAGSGPMVTADCAATTASSWSSGSRGYKCASGSITTSVRVPAARSALVPDRSPPSMYHCPWMATGGDVPGKAVLAVTASGCGIPLTRSHTTGSRGVLDLPVTAGRCPPTSSPSVECQACQLGAACDAQLWEDLVEVVADCAGAEEQSGADVSVR